jgi:aryl-alcohol dehydrogenase-like predicted oxidoreductase
MNPRVTLGRSGLQVSPICFGTWQLSPHYWGDVPQEPIVAAVRAAFDLGVNFFDTADAYGNGLSETVLGSALRELPRDQIVVATKAFWHFFPEPDKRNFPDLSGPYLAQACDNSLHRLGLDYIDLYQCHSYDQLTPMHETVAALEKLVTAGKIRSYGVSNWSCEQMRLGHRHGSFATVQPPYSLLRRDIEADVLPYCQSQNMGVLVYSPLQKGLLTGKYKGEETFTDGRQRDAMFQGERFRNIAQRVAQAGEMAQRLGMSITQLVLTATLAHPGVTCAIVGVKEPAHITEAAGAMNKTISREDWYALRSLVHSS